MQLDASTLAFLLYDYQKISLKDINVPTKSINFLQSEQYLTIEQLSEKSSFITSLKTKNMNHRCFCSRMISSNADVIFYIYIQTMVRHLRKQTEFFGEIGEIGE